MSSKYTDIFSNTEQAVRLQMPQGGTSPAITAHDLTRKAAALYEKIRSFIDYQDENQIKRRVIERIIKRKSLFGKKDSTGRSIVEELVGIGYLPNDAVPESRALQVQHIIDYYHSLSSVDVHNANFRNWAISLASVEIHELLFDHSYDIASLEMLLAILRDNVKFDEEISADRKEKILIVAAQRVLFEASLPEQYFALWKHEHNQRRSHFDSTDASQYILSFWKESRLIIEDNIVWTVANKIKDEAIAVKLIREFAGEYAGAANMFTDKHRAENSMRHFLEETYKKESNYVRKNGVRAVIYLLFTKMILAVVLEVPIDLWLVGHIAFFSLAINVIFHPLLLLFITRRPLGFSSDNTHRAIGRALAIIDGHVDPIFIKIRKKTPYELAYFLLYGLLYAVTFGIIVGALATLNFNAISMLLFLVFLALVSYFGVRIRSHALRYKLNAGKEKILSMLGNLFMLPIVRMGRYLSTKFSTINALVFIMDFIIETPFKLVLKVFNDFLYFLRDKREDVF